MAEHSDFSERVLHGEMTVIDYICEASSSSANSAELPSDYGYWSEVRDAKKAGKKLIFINGPVPTEIIYALDCVPVCLDLIPSRLSENSSLSAQYINKTETHSNAALCSLNKLSTGVLISKSLGLAPDAYLSCPISCESARAACTGMAKYIDAPAFHFDIPKRQDERSIRYIKMQLLQLIELLESVSEKKLNWDKVIYRMELYNKSAELLFECANMRKSHPCPMSSHLTVWNELMNAYASKSEMVTMLQKELSLCSSRIENSYSPCPDDEKHRLMLIHNTLWNGLEITEWLERSYNTVTVLDGFCYGQREQFLVLDNKDESLSLMCRRMQAGSMAHGSGVSGAELLSSIEAAIQEYAPDVFIFMGSVGCRHVWADVKLVSDALQEKYGLPILLMDIDNTDSRYKSNQDIKAALAEYMDTVINGK